MSFCQKIKYKKCFKGTAKDKNDAFESCDVEKVKKRCGHDDMSAAGSVVGGILYE